MTPLAMRDCHCDRFKANVRVALRLSPDLVATDILIDWIQLVQLLEIAR